MISREEILAMANETGLRPDVVEKDFVLGWLLEAIHQNVELSEVWVFKGGTCLKKCYFETYRFSEDLDFTLRDENHLEEDFLRAQFTAIADWLYEQAGIEIPKDRFVFDIHENPRGRLSCQGRIYYQSYFASGKQSLPKIKLDLTADEVLVMPPSMQSVVHPYSDVPEAGISANCYAFPEVFGEKVRALGERGRPRDLYDVINLFRNERAPSAAVIRDVLAQKCAYKEIGVPVLDDMEAYRDPLVQNWEPMLGHQLPSLPAFELYWDALPEFFRWLDGQEVKQATQLGAVSGSGQVYRPAYGQLRLQALNGSSLEIIRFAAGNRLCVDLDYTADSGRRSSRIIEPYSLRQAAGTGNILLYAVRVDNGQIRAYKIDQINAASVVNQTFTPRYQVELTPDYSVPPAPVHRAAGSSRRLGLPARTVTRRQGSRSSAARGIYSGPTYVYRCPVCDKTFRRKKQDSRLNAHKSKDGWPCAGRTGYLEKVE